MADNLVMNPGVGGKTARTLQTAAGVDWTASVVSYATTIADGANVLVPVSPTSGLPVALAADAEVAIAAGSTLATVTTVGAVTGITNALPAGTNLLGKASASPDTSTIYAGTTALTPKFAAISASSSGDNTIVNAVTGKKIRVLGWSLTSNGTVNVRWKSGASTNLTGLRYLIQYASAGGSPTPFGRFETASNEALVLNLSAAVAVGGELQYIEV